MSSNLPIGGNSDITAPTPQNTPLTQAPISFGLSRPTVPDISEDQEGEAAADERPSADDIKETMIGMVEGKLATLIGKSSGYIESLPVEIKLNVEALKGLQVKQNELHQQYKKECLELEKKVSYDMQSFLCSPEHMAKSLRNVLPLSFSSSGFTPIYIFFESVWIVYMCLSRYNQRYKLALFHNFWAMNSF